VVVTEFLQGKELTKYRDPIEQYLDKVLARQRQGYPDTRVVGSEAVVVLPCQPVGWWCSNGERPGSNRLLYGSR